MNGVIEFVSALVVTSLIYAARGWFGKQLLTLLFVLLKFLGKKVLKLSQQELKLYRDQKEAARLSRINRAPKRSLHQS